MNQTMQHKDALLIEIGTEEIPAGLAPKLGEALRDAVATLLSDARVDVGHIRLGVTPRRLLLHAVNCPLMQDDHEQTIWGPPERVAYVNAEPSKAAHGFARKSGLPLTSFSLADKGDGKGRYMCATTTQTGQSVVDILAASMANIIRNLPCGKQMRWQDGTIRNDGFIRPIRWIVARLGDAVIPFSYAGVTAGFISRGHRILGEPSCELDPHHPFEQLKLQYVVADRDARRHWIAEQLELAAVRENIRLIDDPALLDEVTDLTEWPQVVVGHYDPSFLRLPQEVSRVELKNHQRCFVTQCDDGVASSVFLAVANIQSTQPDLVANGNERVVNARLADAAFYFDRDPKHSLEQRVEMLNHVVFQDGLGMLSDQVRRLRGFVMDNATRFGIDGAVAQRAAYLCKSDLTTGLVAEFPELQGYMGGIYADMNDEPIPVAIAIAEHYKPIQAEDALPISGIARCIGVAERMDKLLGYFHLQRIPTASADPFGLRRACIGMIRLLADEAQPLNITLHTLIAESRKQWNEQRVTIAINKQVNHAVASFVRDRMLAMAASLGVSRAAISAVLAANVQRPIHQQVALAKILDDFSTSDTGQAIAAANKRVANILRKQNIAASATAIVDSGLFHLPEEHLLFQHLQQAEDGFLASNSKEQLHTLAGLHGVIDQFFTAVMVMDDAAAVRANRLALLARLRYLFLQLGDLSHLSV
ncbi:MAG: glycine--tRNA ligase subunit beta [Mariprofundaceae bacterium]|nr:glycine--tRNA ligase subunit beta [Mariprofundaceae bacterium]